MIDRLFLHHPRSVNESYFEHMGFALRFSFQLALACSVAVIHAFIPCLFEKSASKIVAKLHQRTANRGGH